MKNKVTRKSDNTRIPAEYAILGLLFSDASHGYQLIRHFAPAQTLGQIYHLEMNMLYFLLKKLEREELIVGHNESISTVRSRRIVEITAKGRDEFINWVRCPVRKTREIRLEFLLKFYFAWRIDAASALRLVEEQQKINTDLLIKQKSQLPRIVHSPEDKVQGLILALRIEQNEAVLRWLEECRQSLLNEPEA